MKQQKINYITSETNALHDLVNELYEAMMDDERNEAIDILEAIGQQSRNIKNDIIVEQDEV